MRIFTVLFLCFTALALGACHLDRSGLADPAGPTWDVEPEFFCPGDPVTVSWDFTNMPRKPENCYAGNRAAGFDSLKMCSTNLDCPSTRPSTCFDSYCCYIGAAGCPNASGCYPEFGVTVTADTLTLDPAVDGASIVRSSRPVVPPDTTTFSISGLWASPATSFNESKTTTLVRAVPPTNATLDFGFICTDRGPGWSTVDLNVDPLATEHVRIVGVRNATGHHIQVNRFDPDYGPAAEPFEPSETKRVFNGSVRGRWIAVLRPRDPAYLRTPRCGPTNVEDPWPDLRIQLILECSAEVPSSPTVP